MHGNESHWPCGRQIWSDDDTNISDDDAERREHGCQSSWGVLNAEIRITAALTALRMPLSPDHCCPEFFICLSGTEVPLAEVMAVLCTHSE